MKRNKLFAALLFLLPLFLFSSCLKDQEDYFDKSASRRLADYQQEVKQTLTSAPYGWIFEIYPSKTQDYGGYAFTCEFDSLAVVVRTELSPGDSVKSYYKISPEDATTISFDTYNSLMHFFSEGTQEAYQGYSGDFEFVVDSLSADLVKVHGNKTGNTLYLRKLDRPAKQYLEDQAAFVKKYNDDSNTIFSGEVNGVQIQGEVMPSNLYADVTVGEDTETEHLVFTDKGFRFYEPLKVGNATISEMVYDPKALTYTGTLSNGTPFSLKASFPKWVEDYNAWAGDWTLTFRDGESQASKLVNVDVHLTPVADKSEYLMSGLIEAGDIHLRYMKADNSLEMYTQVVGPALANGDVVRLVIWAQATGYINFGDTPALKTVWDDASQQYLWKDNGAWGTYTTTGFILYEYTADLATRKGWLSTTYTSYLINGKNYLPWLTSIKKK